MAEYIPDEAKKVLLRLAGWIEGNSGLWAENGLGRPYKWMGLPKAFWIYQINSRWYLPRETSLEDSD